MKKSIDLSLQYRLRTPNKNELKTRMKRMQKDNAELNWIMDSKRGKNLIKICRQRIGIPINGIQTSDGFFKYLRDIKNYPTSIEYPDFNESRAHDMVWNIIRNQSLSSRFFESIKSILIFGKILAEQPPAVIPSLVINNLRSPRKELLIRFYPGATIKDDLRSAWPQVMLRQQELLVEKHAEKWEIFVKKEENPSEENSIYVKVYKDTLLEQVTDSIFTRALGIAFNEAGFTKKRFRIWDYKRARRLLEADILTPHDAEKAEILVGDEKKTNLIKKLRQNTGRKLREL